MRILVLGGTSFVGRAIVEEALRTGAEVAVFGRGKTGTDLFPEVPRLIGDRDTGDYAALADGSWDAVVDSSGYVPRHVDQAMDALGDRVGRYLFVSSHAVYTLTGLAPGNDEDTPLRPAVRHTEHLDEATYGPNKVACEEDVVARYGERATIVRPGKVAGPNDNQNTLTYWVRRVARGGRVALPGRPEQPVQIIDARDLAALVVRLLRDDRGGAYTAVGPTVALGEVIALCARVAGVDIEVVPVPEDAVGPMYPLVRPVEVWAGQQRSAARARAAGMPVTPLETTIRDVLAWDRATGEQPIDWGITPEEEARLLADR
ncbi:NAD-dependent epimerase/dehydratase family protein [Longispora urticae]